jgi:hypothetical protein
LATASVSAPSIALACTFEAASPERDAADVAAQQEFRRDAEVVFLGRLTAMELLDDARNSIRVTFRPVLPHFEIEGDTPPDQVSLIRGQCERTAPGSLEERAVVYAKRADDGAWVVVGAVSLSDLLDPAIRDLALATDRRQRQWESE